jgi:hypothetical protein
MCLDICWLKEEDEKYFMDEASVYQDFLKIRLRTQHTYARKWKIYCLISGICFNSMFYNRAALPAACSTHLCSIFQNTNCNVKGNNDR